MNFPVGSKPKKSGFFWISALLLFILTVGPGITPTRADAGLALEFDGVNDYAALGDTGDLMGTDAWVDNVTVSLWLRLTSPTAPTTSPPAGALILGVDYPRLFSINRAVFNGQDKIWLWNADGGSVDILGIDFVVGEWMHIALVHSGGMLYAYRNGALVGSIASDTTNVPNQGAGDGRIFIAGSGRSNPAMYIQGQIDEVSIWNMGLDEATIMDWWDREITPDHPYRANLAAYYQMTDGFGAVLSDNSGNGHTASLNGGMSNANWVPSGALGGGPPAETPTPTITTQPPTPTPTSTPAGPTFTPTNTSEPPTPTETFTPEPPTNTPTDTQEPPTATSTATATMTDQPPTATATATLVPPSPTSTSTFTPTFTPSATQVLPSPTSTGTFTPTFTPTQTQLPPSPTATFTPTPPTSTPTPPPTGSGYALKFDGSNDYVRLYETAHMMGTGWESTKTVSLWVRPTGPTPVCAYNSVAFCDNIFGDRPRWWGIARGQVLGQDRIWIFNADGGFLSYMDQIGITYTPGEWVHISLVHSNEQMTVYKNGLEVGTIFTGPTQQPNTGAYPVLHLGGIINNASRNWTFEGQIDAVKIWNFALSPSQVLQDINQVLSGTEPGLVAYYRMSDGSGTLLTDNSANYWDGVLFDGGVGVPPDGSPPQWEPPGID